MLIRLKVHSAWRLLRHTRTFAPMCTADVRTCCAHRIQDQIRNFEMHVHTWIAIP